MPVVSADDFSAIAALLAAFIALYSVREQRLYSQRQMTFEMLESIQELEHQASFGIDGRYLFVLAAADWSHISSSEPLAWHLKVFNAIDRMALAAENGVVDKELMRKGLAHLARVLPFYQHVLESIEDQFNAPGAFRAAREFFDGYEVYLGTVAYAKLSAGTFSLIGDACFRAMIELADGEKLPFPIIEQDLNELAEEAELLESSDPDDADE